MDSKIDKLEKLSVSSSTPRPKPSNILFTMSFVAKYLENGLQHILKIVFEARILALMTPSKSL